MRYIHKTKGILSPSGKQYSPIQNKSVDVYADENGKKHTLDGTEKPMASLLAQMDVFAKDEADKKQKEILSDEHSEEKEEEKMKNDEKHDTLLEKIEESSEKMVQAIKEIPEYPEFPEIPAVQIPDHTEEQRKWKDEILHALKFEFPEVDMSPVVSAIENIRFPDITIPAQKDYSRLLEEIKKTIPKGADMTGVITAIQAIPKFQIPEDLIKNGRIKVEVDRVSLGGGSGGNGLATEETLQALVDASGEYSIRVIFIGTDIYVGKALVGSIIGSSIWQVKKIDAASDIVVTWADGNANFDNVFTNPSALTYA